MKTKNIKNTENKKIEQAVFTKAGKLIRQHNLIENGDLIALGLSGGIDSLVLLEILSNRRRILSMNYRIFAVHVKNENIPYKADEDYLMDFCKGLDVSLKIINSGSDFYPEKHKNPCYICSKLRRNALFDFALESGCNKLAMGHHMDDAVETLLLNMAFQGRISSMPPDLTLFDGKLRLVRPLLLLSDREIKKYGELRQFRKMIKNCPFEKDSKREKVRQIASALEDIYPEAKKSLMSSMSNIDEEYLFK